MASKPVKVVSEELLIENKLLAEYRSKKLLSDLEIKSVNTFLNGYSKVVNWRLTHSENIQQLLNPRLHLFLPTFAAGNETFQTSALILFVNNICYNYEKAIKRLR